MLWLCLVAVELELPVLLFADCSSGKLSSRMELHAATMQASWIAALIACKDQSTFRTQGKASSL